MVLLNDMSLKNLAKTAIGFLSALFSFLAVISFNLIEEPGFGGINAWRWFFDAEFLYSWEISGFGTFLVLVSFAFVLATVGLFLATFILAPNVSTYSKGMRLVTIIAVIATLVLMVAGFIVTGDFGKAMRFFEYGTATYIPFIITVVLAIGNIGADMVL